jgi:hypothetical protein
VSPHKSIRILCAVLLVCVACRAVVSGAVPSTWQREDVNWRVTGGSQIKAIYRPPEEAVAKSTPAKAAPIAANVIDSPPEAGLVPWIAVVTTDARGEELDLVAVAESSIIGTPTADPQNDYAIGIFDTGASAHIMGYEAAYDQELFNIQPSDPCHTFVTGNEIEITGVTDSTFASVSYPLAIFIDGLNAIDSGGLLDTSGMVGQSNVSILVGQEPDPCKPDLPTAIGSPLSVYFTTVFHNDQPVTVNRGGEQYVGTGVRIYDDPCDPSIPTYSAKVPLELRPLGGTSVQYIPDFNFYDLDLVDLLYGWSFDTPGTPSIIMGNLSQSIFFVHSVDITEGSNSASDKNRFMFDTGAQVSVIGNRIGARLGLDPANPDGWVLITGVTGKTTSEPLFIIDSLQIPALGEWLTFTNVPMVLLDIASPEGGTLDGIIGMNLFVDFNFVLRGGGMFLQPDPVIEFQHIDRGIADFAPGFGDGEVDAMDLLIFALAWQSTEGVPNWNPRCDMAPQPTPDGKIDLLDFGVLFEHWLEGTE